MSSQPIISDFFKSLPVEDYRKGDIIVFQGEAPRFAYIIASGMVKAYNLTLSGDENPVAFYKPGDFFPSAWIFSLVASSTFFYEAFSKQVSLYFVDREEFIKYLKSNSELMFETLTRQVSEELSQSMHINSLQQSRASDKIVYILHFLAISSGSPPVGRQLTLGVRLTHQDLANLTGLTRETTAVELNKLKKQGLIDYGPGKNYSINLDKLTTLSNDRYIQELTLPPAADESKERH